MGKVRFFKATSLYQEFVDSIYANFPDLKERSYQEQYDKLMSFKFASADFWKLNLEKRGDFIVEDVLINIETLQKKWAEEHKVSYGEHWISDIFAAQVKSFKPQILFYHEAGSFDFSFRDTLKKEVKSIQLTLSIDGVASNNIERYKGIDVMVSCLDYVADFYSNNGFDGVYLPFGFEKSILDSISFGEKKYDTSFAGSLNVLMKNGHHERMELISHIADKTNIDLFINNRNIDHWQPFCWPQRQRLFNGQFQEYFNIWKLGKRNNPPRFGLDMYQLLADSRMTINTHIDVARNKAANMRLFEATGVGTCLVTDWKENINDFFEEGYEVVTYKSKEECVEKIKWLQNNPLECEKIGLAGQQKTLNHFSLETRLDQLVTYLFEAYPELLKDV